MPSSSIRTPLASGRSVVTATSALVPSTARRSPPGSSTASFTPSHAGIVIGDADVLDAGQIDHVELVGAATARRRPRRNIRGSPARRRSGTGTPLPPGSRPHLGLLPLRRRWRTWRRSAPWAPGSPSACAVIIWSRALADGLIAGLHLDRIERLHVALRQTRPTGAMCRSRGSPGRTCRARSAPARRPPRPRRS